MVELFPGIELSFEILIAAVVVVLVLVLIVVFLSLRKKRRGRQSTIEDEQKKQALSPEEQMRRTIIEEEKARPEEQVISPEENELKIEEHEGHFVETPKEEQRELKSALKPQSSLNDVDRLVSLLRPKKSQYSKEEIRQVLKEEGYSKEMQGKVIERLGV